MDKIITTRYGKVEGFEENGLLKYLGIPYAAQPVGPLRWKRAQECEKRDGVIYVNFQYRLNVIGFYDFSTYKGCEEIESNRGLSDMIMALKFSTGDRRERFM